MSSENGDCRTEPAESHVRYDDIKDTSLRNASRKHQHNLMEKPAD